MKSEVLPGLVILLKRIYEVSAPEDGTRILVDRIWPRGISKAKANIVFWAKESAPSNELRRWFDHRPERWPEFKRRYFRELDKNPRAVNALLSELAGETVTFLFSSREASINNASALREYLQERGHLGRAK